MLIIIFFIIILLYIGVKISLEYEKNDDELKGCLKILILKKIKIYSLEYPSDDEEEYEEEEETESDSIDYKKLLKLAKPCFKYFIEFLKSVLKTVKIKKLENHLILGLDSYTDTAKYIGIIWGIMAIVNTSHENAKLSAEPRFNGGTINAKGVNELEINILKLLAPLITLISKKEVRTLIRGVLNE